MLNRLKYLIEEYPIPLVFAGTILFTIVAISCIPFVFHKTDKQEIVEVQKTQDQINADAWAKIRIMSNDEVITETQKCKDAGLAYQTWGYFDNEQPVHGVTQVICITDSSTDKTDK